MSRYAFETRKLTVGYDGKPLIENIEIAIEPGQVMTLIGPNGAGKSTILKSISKQLQIVDGTVLVEGRDLAGISASELAKTVSMLFSTAPRTELLTCQDIVETGRYPYTGRMGVLRPPRCGRSATATSAASATASASACFWPVRSARSRRS